MAVMYNDNLSYAENFEDALNGLFTETSVPESTKALIGRESIEELIQKASQAFENYLQKMQEREFDEAGKELNSLEEALKKLSEGTEEAVLSENNNIN